MSDNKTSGRKPKTDSPFRKSFRNKLEQFRKSKGLNQKEFCSATGISQSTYSNYESGNRFIEGVETIYKICKHYGVSLDYFFDPDTTIETSDKDIKYICRQTGLSEHSINVLYQETAVSRYSSEIKAPYQSSIIKVIDILLSLLAVNERLIDVCRVKDYIDDNDITDESDLPEKYKEVIYASEEYINAQKEFDRQHRLDNDFIDSFFKNLDIYLTDDFSSLRENIFITSKGKFLSTDELFKGDTVEEIDENVQSLGSYIAFMGQKDLIETILLNKLKMQLSHIKNRTFAERSLSDVEKDNEQENA